MKKMIISTLVLLLSLNTFASSLPKFNELSASLQTEIINELGARPVFVRDLSNITGVDGSYIGLVEINKQTYSFNAFIWHGTQGADGIAINNLIPVESL